MTYEWKTVKLGEHSTKIGSGATPRGGKNVYLDEGEMSLIRSQNIYNDGFKKDGIVYISDGAAIKLKNSAVKENDVLLNITGDSVARVCMAPKEYLPAFVNQHVAIIRPNPNDFDARFVKYYLSSPKMQEKMLAIASSGATRNALTKGHIENFDIPKPSMAEQEAIATHLEALDNKIQLNQQINQTLEQMAQALFKSWFVDFEPTKAKIAALETGDNEEDANLAAMQAISGKTATELEQLKSQNQANYQQLYTTAQHFPAAMQESELGEIPVRWEVTSIESVAEVIKGKSYKSAELQESDTALVTLKSFNRGGGYRLDGLKEYVGNYKPQQEVIAGDLVIAYTDVTQAANVIGKPAMVVSDYRYKHLVISLDVGVVRPIDVTLKPFLYGLASTDSFQAHTKAHTTGTTVLHLSKDAVPEFKFAMPSKELIGFYAENATPLFQLIDEKIQESRSLENLRDTLLPKLLSGELSINFLQEEIHD